MGQEVATGQLARKARSAPVLPVKRAPPRDPLARTKRVRDLNSDRTEPLEDPLESEIEEGSGEVDEEVDEIVETLENVDDLTEDLGLVQDSVGLRKEAKPEGLNKIDLGLGTLGVGTGSTKLAGTQDPDDSRLGDSGSGMGVLTGGLGALNQLRGMNKTRKKFKNKTWKDQSTSTNVGRVARGVHKATGLAGNVSKVIKGGKALAGNAKEAKKFGKDVVAPLGIVTGSMDVIQGGLKHRRTGINKKKLQKARKKLDPETDGRQLRALDHLQEVQDKKRKRAKAEMGFGTAGVVAGALTVSGVGAPVALGLGVGVGAVKVGQAIHRKGKQKFRDRKAKKLEELEGKRGRGEELTKKEKKKLRKSNAIQELRARKKNGEKLSWKERARLRLALDEGLSSDKKQQRNIETASTLLDMGHDEQLEALSTLGIDAKKWVKISGGTREEQLVALVKALKKR